MSDAPGQDEVRGYFEDPAFPRLPPGCGAPHPDQEGVFCEKSLPCLDLHMTATVSEIGERTAIVWDNPEKTPKRVANHAKAQEMADRVEVSPARGEGSGIPVDAERVWNQEAWVEQTKTAFRSFLRDRPEPFTTPEDFWPLIDAPQEMRALSVVVQHALRQEWMVEDGGVRLRGDYASRDGVPFKINKIVPIYRSQIASPSGATG